MSMSRIQHLTSAAIVLFVTAAAASAQPAEMIDPPGATSIRESANRPDILPAVPRFPRRPELDRASRKALENLRRVGEEERLRYNQFLKGDNTGIFKLFPDSGCTAKNLIRVDGDCEGFVPDSSVYSFRPETYARGAGDIYLYRGTFASRIFFAQPIIASIGDVAIEDVGVEHPAARLLAEMEPPFKPAAAERASMLLAHGVSVGGYTFAANAAASIGTTYLLRQIAYNVKGKVPKQKVKTRFGVFEVPLLKRNLEHQERKDTIYAFRVVRKDDDGALTIVWKQLSRKDAPAIVFEKGDKVPSLVWRVPRPER